MRVTIIASDKSIIVDGEVLKVPDFVFDEQLHAVQFDGHRGHIEFLTADGGICTAPISELEVQPYVEAWNAEKARLDAKGPLESTEVEKAQQRIIELRQQLTANDIASVRPLRAKVAGTATAEDEARLVELEEQAQALRAELAEVSA